MALPNTYSTAGSDPNIGGVYKQEWETKLQERLDYPISYKDVCKVIYSPTYAINYPYMSTEYTAQTGTRGCSYSFSEYTITNDQLIINSQKIVPIAIDRADLSQMSLMSQMEAAERHAALINEVIETAYLGGHVGWTDFDNSAIGGSAGNITVSVNNINKIITGIKREILENNAQNLADRNGIFIAWRAADKEKLEEFAQANGHELADYALKNGIPNGYFYMGVYHYVSNSHTAGHVFAGVRGIMQIGLLTSTFGRLYTLDDPASGVSTYGPISSIGIVSRVDYGINTPTGLKTAVFDVLVA